MNSFSKFSSGYSSRVPASERINQIERYKTNLKRVSLTHLEGDYLVPSDLSDLNLRSYDNIVMPGSDRLDTKEAADARTLLGFYLVQEMLEAKTSNPGLLVELFDPDNLNLIQGRGVEVLVIPGHPQSYSGPRGPAVHLNPDRESRWPLQERDAIVVLATVTSLEAVSKFWMIRA